MLKKNISLYIYEAYPDLCPSTLTSLGCLDGCVDKTLSASHGVEEELSGRQTGQVGVLHEASALRTVIILDEVRQRAVFEAEGDSLTLHVLLPHHGDNLDKEVR